MFLFVQKKNGHTVFNHKEVPECSASAEEEAGAQTVMSAQKTDLQGLSGGTSKPPLA